MEILVKSKQAKAPDRLVLVANSVRRSNSSLKRSQGLSASDQPRSIVIHSTTVPKGLDLYSAMENWRRHLDHAGHDAEEGFLY